MKFCLNSNLPFHYLQKADQIKVSYEHFITIPKLLEHFPEKELIVCFPYPPEEEEIIQLKQYIKLNPNIILCYGFFPSKELQKEFKYYTNQVINNFSEARALIEHGAVSLKIGEPLTFQLNDLKYLPTQIRLTPNRSWLSIIPRENGICGQWIRPEDLYRYDVLKDVIVEFDLCNTIEQETALYRIYAEEKKWPGEMFYLIPDINVDTINRLLPDYIGEVRINCGQRCMNTKVCHVCPRAFKIADMVEDEYLIDKN